jgi:hypothetical protein
MVRKVEASEGAIQAKTEAAQNAQKMLDAIKLEKARFHI